MKEKPPETAISIAALYCFAPLADPAALAQTLREQCQLGRIKGTLLCAYEGINGTIAGEESQICAILKIIESAVLPETPMIRRSFAQKSPFLRLKVKVKREIVTMGTTLTNQPRGTYVAPADWDALIADPATKVIDVRNAFEVARGSFAGAIDPGTASFGEFPAWLENFVANTPPETPVAMFCTGGIRCEKATAVARAMGLANVFHLEGGILAYLESRASGDSGSFAGDCFIFDEREALGPGLVATSRDAARP